MNTALLLLIAVILFGLGYRFYGKLLAMVFEDVPERPAFAPYFALTALPAILGAGTAAAWGWAPAFLIVIIGATVIGATYGMAVLALGRDGGLLGAARRYLGRGSP